MSKVKEIGLFSLHETIGEGAFSIVRRATSKIFMNNAAAKIIPKGAMDEKRIIREFQLLKSLNHPYICPLYEYIEEKTHHYFIMEFLEGGSLLDLISANALIPDDVVRHYFVQIVMILEYLHKEKHMVHRDIKAENIMIDSDNNIRLIDFGLGNSNQNDCALYSTACGSTLYASPEMLKGISYDDKCDIWSAGVVLYLMVYGKYPFYDSNASSLAEKIVETDPIFDLKTIVSQNRISKSINLNLVNLLQNMLKKDPLERISLEQIAIHPWVAEGNLYEKHKQDLTTIINTVEAQKNANFDEMHCKLIDCQLSFSQMETLQKISYRCCINRMLSSISNLPKIPELTPDKKIKSLAIIKSFSGKKIKSSLDHKLPIPNHGSSFRQRKNSFNAAPSQNTKGLIESRILSY